MVLGRADEGRAALGDLATADLVVEGATADPVAGLEDGDGMSVLGDLPRRRQAGEAGADDRHVDAPGAQAAAGRSLRFGAGHSADQRSGAGGRTGSEQPAAGDRVVVATVGHGASSSSCRRDLIPTRP